MRQAALDRKQERFTALLDHLTVDLFRHSFFALKRKAAPDVDGVTWQEYASGLGIRTRVAIRRGQPALSSASEQVGYLLNWRFAP